MKKDYYDLLFNFSLLKEENEALKKNTQNNSSTNDTYKPQRPQTAKIKETDSIFKSTIDSIKLFKENPLFDQEDIIDKYQFNLRQNEKKNDINSEININKVNDFQKKLSLDDYNEIIADAQLDLDDEEDEEMKDIINKSISDFKMIQEFKDFNEKMTTDEIVQISSNSSTSNMQNNKNSPENNLQKTEKSDANFKLFDKKSNSRPLSKPKIQTVRHKEVKSSNNITNINTDNLNKHISGKKLTSKLPPLKSNRPNEK